MQVVATGYRTLSPGSTGKPELTWLSLCICVRVWRRVTQTCAVVMALRKSPVPVSDVSSHLSLRHFYFSTAHTLRLNDSTNPIGLPPPGWLLPMTCCRDVSHPSRVTSCVTASGSAYPDVTNQHNNQVPGSHPSWHATIRFASPCLSPHAAPLSPFSLHNSQQSARTLPNLQCLFLTVAAVSTRRRSSAHQGDDEPRDGT